MNSSRTKMLIALVTLGVVSGASSSLFLWTLKFVTEVRQSNPSVIWALPLAGLLIGSSYFKWGGVANLGFNLVKRRVLHGRPHIPKRTALMIWLGTLLTHLFGGSAGREGTAVQMSAALSEGIGKRAQLSATQQLEFITYACAAGFAGAIGAPIAGAVFGSEVFYPKKLRARRFLFAFLVSSVAFLTTWILAAPHTEWPHVQFQFVPLAFGGAFVLGLTLGLTGFIFSQGVHLLEATWAKAIRRAWLRPFMGGVLLVVAFWLEGSNQFSGLGIESIQQAFHAPSEFRAPLLKIVFTILTIGTGFKGGEFIPLVFIGSTFGSAMSPAFQLSPEILSAIGFVALYASVMNVPITGTVLAIELFGIRAAPLALIACFVASIIYQILTAKFALVWPATNHPPSSESEP